MDVFLGIDDPTQDAWEAWHREMLAERARAAIDELERTNKTTAVVTLCIGGGQGIATVLERV